MILGPILEANLRRSLLISREGYWIFLDRPVSAALVAVNLLLMVAMVYLSIQRDAWREENRSSKSDVIRGMRETSRYLKRGRFAGLEGQIAWHCRALVAAPDDTKFAGRVAFLACIVVE